MHLLHYLPVAQVWLGLLSLMHGYANCEYHDIAYCRTPSTGGWHRPKAFSAPNAADLAALKAASGMAEPSSHSDPADLMAPDPTGPTTGAPHATEQTPGAPSGTEGTIASVMFVTDLIYFPDRCYTSFKTNIQCKMSIQSVIYGRNNNSSPTIFTDPMVVHC